MRKGRIIEICILIHDGLSVVEKYSTLIDPECYITPNFIRISGITNEMVEGAPKFHEVAKDILRLTENCIFVAHNVGFDYGFVREEFASLGYKYRKDTLCTVRLSRKLIPGKMSYSLGNLCASLGIEIENRHRAEGDAVATAKLFDLLLQIKSEHPQYRKQGIEELMVRRVDKIKEYILKKIPEDCGVYYFLDADGQIIYIGKSVNAYKRAQSHFLTTTKKAGQMLHELTDVDFVPTGSELVALLMEAAEIKKHQPKYNRRSKAVDYLYAIEFANDEAGCLQLKIVTQQESENPLLRFTTYSSAREILDSWIAKSDLCLSKCGLSTGDEACFNYHIHKCNGVCVGAEEVAIYNKRVRKLVLEHSYPNSNFFIVEKGREPDEQVIILVYNNRFYGYGYFDFSQSFQSVEELVDAIKPMPYYPDADSLLLNWIKSKQVKLQRLK